MSKFFKNASLPSAVLLSVTLVLATRAVAANALETGIIPQQPSASSKPSASSLNAIALQNSAGGAIAQSTQEINTPSQEAEVSEPLDIKPTDSTAQSVPSTVERYGCLSGYSDSEASKDRSADRTYQGNQPLSRYEFAAALNACLNQVEKLINSNTADRVTQEDLAVPKRQLETLQSDLERLQMRLDGLD
jgi:hypothetical protein